MNSPFLTTLTAMFSLLSFSMPLRAIDPLLSGHGISKLHPGDQGIVRHPAVLLAEDFESTGIQNLKPLWNEIENLEGKVLAFVADRPAASPGQ